MIDWSKQHCGVHQATISVVKKLMPDLTEVLKTFPDDPIDFTWDVKVHMLMPNQYPCIPNWHFDNVPRVNGIQRFDLIKPGAPMYSWLSGAPMYSWLSGAPLTQFKHGFVEPKKWHRFSQLDEHRGTASGDFTWRCFIRATHRSILSPKVSDWQRRHCQVYLNAETYQW